MPLRYEEAKLAWIVFANWQVRELKRAEARAPSERVNFILIEPCGLSVNEKTGGCDAGMCST